MPAFPVIHRTSQITPDQKHAILRLTDCCRKQDSISLTYPLSQEELVSEHFLLTDAKGRLLSVLALLPLEEEVWECIAFTHPEHRHRGYFSRLLSLALENLKEQDLLFPVSGSCADTLAALEALGAELFRQELEMERELSFPLPWLPTDRQEFRLLAPEDIFSENALWQLVFSQSLSRGTGSSPSPLLPSDTTWTFGNPMTDQAFFSCPDILGSCRTSPVSSKELCLHQVEISPSLRGRGFGTALICLLLSFLQKEPAVEKIILHVSGDNQAAVSLYKKTGFRITETLSYYLY